MRSVTRTPELSHPGEQAALRSSQNGLADLTFLARGGRTILTDVHTRSPLVIQRALYLDESRPDMAHVFIANPTAGLLAGDRHEIRAQVGPGARARVLTQAATKVYSMPHGQAEQVIQLSVAAGGALEYLPRAVIPYRSSCLEQRVVLEVAEGATAVYAEVLGAGRVRHGESLAYRSISSSLTVQRPSGQLLLIESYRLCPAELSLAQTGILGLDPGVALVTLVAIGDALRPEECAARLQDRLGAAATRTAAAPLPGGGGMIVKVLAGSAAEGEALLGTVYEECQIAFTRGLGP
ncbi:MAG: urease accessory protein UreD [Chloroflexota bacterium]